MVASVALDLQPGSVVNLAINPGAMHVFDGASGLRVN